MSDYNTDRQGYSRRCGDAQRSIRTQRTCPVCSSFLMLDADEILRCDGTAADGRRCTYQREVPNETH